VTQDLVILSPEKTVLTYRLAGLGSRAIAQLVDLLIVIALIFGIGMLLALTIGSIDQGIYVGMLLLTSILGPFAYFILFEGLWNGQTPGKRAAGIRVHMADGTPVTMLASIGRNLLRAADFLPSFYFLGLLAIFTNPKAQRLGDLIADTVVCVEWRPDRMAMPAPHSVGVHAFESAVGDLRGMTIEEYNALRRLCDRYPELPPEVRNSLMQEVFMPITQRRKIPMQQNVHPIYIAEATVMKYGRQHGLL
jgi:uncharacterized RDD family membrane protein YckC